MSVMLSYFLFIIIFTVIALSLYFGLQAIKLI
nr:cytochrome b6f complex subunit VI [Grateloupia asiatica]WOL36929.1 cytochrome b6f complex subunit VI [Grateloupia asiatica]